MRTPEASLTPLGAPCVPPGSGGTLVTRGKLHQDVGGTRYRIAGPTEDGGLVHVVCSLKEVGGLIIMTPAKKTVKKQHWLKAKLYIIENVEAEVCTQCGGRYFHAKTFDAIDRLLESDHEVSEGMDVEVVLMS